jgi:hypothetical protein
MENGTSPLVDLIGNVMRRWTQSVLVVHLISLDYTGDNTYVGLAGHYLVRDCESDLELNYLPKPKHTVPLLYKVRRPLQRIIVPVSQPITRPQQFNTVRELTGMRLPSMKSSSYPLADAVYRTSCFRGRWMRMGR